MNSSYGQPYSHDPRAAASYPPAPYPYAGAPPPPGPSHSNSYHGQYPRRGRGGGGGGDSEPEDDEQEGLEDEKVLAELLGKETPAIDDVAKYLEQRRKNFPTRARIEAKKAAELAQDKEDKAASLEKEADRLRKQLRKVEFSIKRKREQGDEGDEMRDPSEEPSDDEKPEVMTSRSQAQATAASLSGKKADISRHCKYYSTGGTCGKKGKCRFVHDPAVREAALKEREANNGRLTIQQRLILNDKEQEDLAVLQSIQYLRDKGLMTSVAAAETKPEEKAAEEEKKNKKQTTSALASLPGLKHYESWLLQPYGSTSGKQAHSDNLP
ncbi:hypothetical protein ESCO_001147 [Escovopsis weberi]|uniref:C3H1-type domain-containing protein n=1 Tax=Escovopsis weberi TaxID=150374 RepID=A0A0M8MTQ1_ESCWE|nr:hypothetical protein ESCO_001147 [Escovopsis weberi]